MDSSSQHHIPALKKAGLSEKSATVYAALLELGGAHPSRIAEYTKLNRSTVYKVLLDLSIKGLITEIERRNKLFYQVEKPIQLERFAQTQVQLANERLQWVKKILPDIQELTDTNPHQPKIRYFDTVDGITAIYQDHLDTSEPYEMVGWSNVGKLTSFLPKKFLEQYAQEKAKHRITSRGIFSDTEADQKYRQTIYRNIRSKYQPKTKFISKSLFPYAAEITLYKKTKISLINFTPTALSGVIIDDPTIHNLMRMIFEQAWQT